MSDPTHQPPPPSPPPRPLAEALLAFGAATAAVAALWHLGNIVPWFADNLHALVAILFLYIPAAVAWRRGEDLRAFGLTTRPLGRSLAFGLGVPAIVFPVFLVGFVAFYGTVCARGAGPGLAALAPPGWCPRFTGWAGLAHPRAPLDVWETTLAQFVVVALPEELFFRGYLLDRLERAFPPRRRVLGGGVGVALVLSALLFGLAHVLVDLDPRRLAVFFPGLLFGWMRSATGSVAAGTIVHGASNLYIDALQRTFFR